LCTKFDLIIYGTDPQAFKPDPTGVEELRVQLQAAGGEKPRRQGDRETGRQEDKEQDDTQLATRNSQLAPHHPVILLCVGRMVPKKGFDVFAVMVGEGDDKAAWQQLAERLGVSPRLRWVGNVPKTAIGVYYNLADVLINPSVNRPVDGLNVCVLDAMSCGKPVIGSNVAGNPLAIVDGETGLIVPEQDGAALALAIARLVDDADLRHRLGAAARARIETELGWPHLAERYIEHFRQLQRKI
jgi:glycosyltransferase involved in cell wall biosynthesis